MVRNRPSLSLAAINCIPSQVRSAPRRFAGEVCAEVEDLGGTGRLFGLLEEFQDFGVYGMMNFEKNRLEGEAVSG